MRPLILLTILVAGTAAPIAQAGGIETGAMPVPSPTEATPPAATSPVTAEQVLAQLLVRIEAEDARRREFEQTHAYVLERVTERRDVANQLRDREVEREEHDPRTGPDEPAEKGPGYRQKDFKVNQSLLDRYRITMNGVEEVNGRPAWALEFAPVDPPLPARDLKERFLNQLAGRVWVDQADYATARLELRLIKPVNVIGGLVGAVKACQVVLQRERTAGGLWFNAHMRWRLEGRRFLVTNVLLFEERRAEVRRVIEPGTAGAPPGSATASGP